jgi:hypothetical protein
LEGEQRQGFKRVELDLRNGTAVSPTGGVEKERDDEAAVEAEAEENIRSGGRGDEREREMAIEEQRAPYRCSLPPLVQEEWRIHIRRKKIMLPVLDRNVD